MKRKTREKLRIQKLADRRYIRKLKRAKHKIYQMTRESIRAKIKEKQNKKFIKKLWAEGHKKVEKKNWWQRLISWLLRKGVNI